jgi:DNA-binding response OmpR family regulator
MKKILIVEDNPDIQKLLQAMLKRHYAVVVAKNGTEALTLTKEQCPDLILLDVGLPDFDGFQVCNEIRSAANKQDISIVFLSARKDAASQTMAYRLGADDYIEKPVEEAKLLAIVDSKFRRGEQRGKKETNSFGNVTIDSISHKVFIADNEVKFTSKEFKILKFLINLPNTPITREKLIDSLWDHASETTHRSVDNHIFNIRKKLNSSNIEINSEYGQGYILSEK